MKIKIEHALIKTFPFKEEEDIILQAKKQTKTKERYNQDSRVRRKEKRKQTHERVQIRNGTLVTDDEHDSRWPELLHSGISPRFLTAPAEDFAPVRC